MRLSVYGPSFQVSRSCFGCRHCRNTSYQVQSDSGHDVKCGLVDRHIGDTRWDTPDWCPYLTGTVATAAVEATP